MHCVEPPNPPLGAIEDSPATVPQIVQGKFAVPECAEDQVDELRRPAIAVFPTGVALLPAAEQSGDLTLAKTEANAQDLILS